MHCTARWVPKTEASMCNSCQLTFGSGGSGARPSGWGPDGPASTMSSTDETSATIWPRRLQFWCLVCIMCQKALRSATQRKITSDRSASSHPGVWQSQLGQRPPPHNLCGTVADRQECPPLGSLRETLFDSCTVNEWSPCRRMCKGYARVPRTVQ